MIHNPLKNSRSGFTLVELLITMAIAGLLLGAIYSVFASVQKTSTSNDVAARVMQSLRTSIGFMESDIRMAGMDRYGTANAGIVKATTSELRFTSDRSGPVLRPDGSLMDGTINTANLADGLQEVDLEQITYSYDTANKRLIQCLSVNDPLVLCNTVAENVESVAYSYWPDPPPPPAVNAPIPADAVTDMSAEDKLRIRSIEVLIRVEQPAGIADPVERTITRRILCRNLDM